MAEFEFGAMPATIKINDETIRCSGVTIEKTKIAGMQKIFGFLHLSETEKPVPFMFEGWFYE